MLVTSVSVIKNFFLIGDVHQVRKRVDESRRPIPARSALSSLLSDCYLSPAIPSYPQLSITHSQTHPSSHTLRGSNSCGTSKPQRASTSLGRILTAGVDPGYESLRGLNL